jgi:hypothetical protein
MRDTTLSIRLGALSLAVALAHFLLLQVWAKPLQQFSASPIKALRMMVALRESNAESQAPTAITPENKVAPAPASITAKTSTPIALEELLPIKRDINPPSTELGTTGNEPALQEPAPLNLEAYLTSKDLDQYAVPLTDLIPPLSAIYDPLAGNSVVELWIDETGKVVKAQMYRGKFQEQSTDVLHVFLDAQFSPGIKAGVPVPSLKVIELYVDARSFE